MTTGRYKRDPSSRKYRRGCDPDVLLALDLYVGALPPSNGKPVAGSVRAVAREMGMHRRSVGRWIEDAWWNVLGVPPTASADLVANAYHGSPGTPKRADAYAQFAAQRGIEPLPEK